MNALRRFCPPIIQPPLRSLEGAAFEFGRRSVGRTAESEADEVLPCGWGEQTTGNGSQQAFELEVGEHTVLDVVAGAGAERIENVVLARECVVGFVGSFVATSGPSDDLVGEILRRFRWLDVVDGEVCQRDVVVDGGGPVLHRVSTDDNGAESWVQGPDCDNRCVGVAALCLLHESLKHRVVAGSDGGDGLVDGGVSSNQCRDVLGELSGGGGVEDRVACGGVWGHAVTLSAGRHGSLPVSLPGWSFPFVFAVARVVLAW